MNDINTPIEGNSVKVKKNSLKYWYHLATAKYFVQNTNMPVWYKKRNGQREIQTFHGTFMKTMGFDTPEFKFETRQHKIDEFQKRLITGIIFQHHQVIWKIRHEVLLI